MWLRKRRVQWRIQSLADLAAAPPLGATKIFMTTLVL